MSGEETFDINGLHEEALEIDKKAKALVEAKKAPTMQEAVEQLLTSKERDEQVPSENVISEELRNATVSLLRQHHINLERWGVGEAKTVDDLLKEIVDDEVALEVEPSGELIHTRSLALVHLYYIDAASGECFIYGSIERKLKTTDHPDETLIAETAREKLGLAGDIKIISSGEKRGETIGSSSYPGLVTRNRVYGFSLILNAEQYGPTAARGERKKIDIPGFSSTDIQEIIQGSKALGVRGISWKEMYALLIEGKVNAENSPFAVISAEEELSDTTPHPPAGTIGLFDRSRLIYQDIPMFRQEIANRIGHLVIECAVPRAGAFPTRGRYVFRDMFGDDPTRREWHDELYVKELTLEEVRGIYEASLFSKEPLTPKTLLDALLKDFEFKEADMEAPDRGLDYVKYMWIDEEMAAEEFFKLYLWLKKQNPERFTYEAKRVIPLATRPEAELSEINVGRRLFKKAEVGYETAEDSKFFIKTVSDRRELLLEIETRRRYVKSVYRDLPHIVPPMKILALTHNGKELFGEYTMKIPFRGFLSAATLYRSEDFCRFLLDKSSAPLQAELLTFIAATKQALQGKAGLETLPEFTTWGNMGIDYANHVRIIDYDLFDIFKKAPEGRKNYDELGDFGYECLMFCLNYEYFLASQNLAGAEDAPTQAGEQTLKDPIYRKHIIDKFHIAVAPEKFGDFLKELHDRVYGTYSNVPAILPSLGTQK